jgi:corrinoid protein of di/trimethylamine methyltransferase
MNSIYEEIVESIHNFDYETLMKNVKDAISQGLEPTEIMEKGISKGLNLIGKEYEEGNLFIVHLVAAAEIVKKVITEILEPQMKKLETNSKSLGKVIIGTVSGDIHDIGKNIVASLLFASGFEVFDLGVDVSPEKYVEKFKETNANVVAASALLSTTLPNQREIVKAFDEAGLRGRVKLIFGGAPVTPEWVEEIGGDGYSEDAVGAVKLIKNLLGIKEEKAI